jgi:hypothetical protein
LLLDAVSGASKENLQATGASALFPDLTLELLAFKVVGKAIGDLSAEFVLFIPNAAHAGELCPGIAVDLEHDFPTGTSASGSFSLHCCTPLSFGTCSLPCGLFFSALVLCLLASSATRGEDGRSQERNEQDSEPRTQNLLFPK